MKKLALVLVALFIVGYVVGGINAASDATSIVKKSVNNRTSILQQI